MNNENSAPQILESMAAVAPAVESALHAHSEIALCVAILSVVAMWRAARKLSAVVLTLRASAWTPIVSRRLAWWIRSTAYSEAALLCADGADLIWAERRRRGLDALATKFRTEHPRSIAWSGTLREGLSDLRFTDANRVPFPFLKAIRAKFDVSAVAVSSEGPRLRDLDGNWSLDVSGSYGVNVAGFERYKEWIGAAWETVRELGPVLGPLHPSVAENIAALKHISKLDEVSFHASGTEAVMAAVRMARFNTRRALIVTFSGAYHGWWDGVQPGLGNERDLGDSLTLKDMDPRSLAVIRRRSREIAAVLVNPVQAFHPNSPPPNDAVLLTSGVRRIEQSTSPYERWLKTLRDVCTESGVPLVFDEVFSGFRVAPGGAQECFGIQADMVVYGKTVAAGLPIGVVCGRRDLMSRFDPVHPMRLAYVIGTFSAHPLVMAGMREFLRWLTKPATAGIYERAAALCDAWTVKTNAELERARLPIRVTHFATIWTVLFTEPSRFSWLFQYYLRAQGITLSWVGTGRCMASLDFGEDDYDELRTKLVSAANQMVADGWWPTGEEQPLRAKCMQMSIARELLRSVIQLPAPLVSLYREVMQRKHDDHLASHSHILNQIGHLLSSSVFLVCYVLAFFDLTLAMTAGLGALLVRQFGHAVIEPACHEKEMKLLGFTTRSKTLVVCGYLAIPAAHLALRWATNTSPPAGLLPAIAHDWFLYTGAVILAHIALIAWQFDFNSAMVWFIKLATDPLTDIVAYSPTTSRAFRALIDGRREA